MRISLAIAILLSSGLANAAAVVNGKVVQYTADKYAAEQQLVCAYGAPRFETVNGRTIIVRSKVCKGATK